VGTKNNPGSYDCYANAEPDEPMFVLLGHDKHAPALVWLWAVLRELDGESPEKVAESRACVTAMVEYGASKGKQMCGLGVAALAAVMELVRSANSVARKAIENALAGEFKNTPTGTDFMRLILSVTPVEGGADPEPLPKEAPCPPG
jgi:hypothetical protein